MSSDRLVRIEDRLDAIESDVAQLNAQLNIGYAGQPSVRSRLHQIENYNAAAKAAEAARDALKATISSRRAWRLTVFNAAVALGGVTAAIITILLH